LNETALEVPPDLLVLVEHQVWVRHEAGGLATVGITALGARLAGEIYMCRVKGVGSVIEQGRGLAVVELAKSIVSVKSPVSGTVAEVNDEVSARPDWIHDEPYGRGWLARLRCPDPAAEAQALLGGEPLRQAMREHARLFRADG
jgi:glycine cleavage system H protein